SGASDRRGHVVAGTGIDVVDEHRRALGSDGLCVGPAQSPAGAGDHHPLVCELHRTPCLLFAMTVRQFYSSTTPWGVGTEAWDVVGPPWCSDAPTSAARAVLAAFSSGREAPTERKPWI